MSILVGDMCSICCHSTGISLYAFISYFLFAVGFVHPFFIKKFQSGIARTTWSMVPASPNINCLFFFQEQYRRDKLSDYV